MANIEKLHNLEDALNVKGVEEQLSRSSPPFEIFSNKLEGAASC